MKKQCKYAFKYKQKVECQTCEHQPSHEQTPECFIKCCDVYSKDVRCVVVE